MKAEPRQIRRERLLHLHRAGLQRLGNAREGGQVGVNGKRPQHAQHGQQYRQGPARGAPELIGRGFMGSSWLDQTGIRILHCLQRPNAKGLASQAIFLNKKVGGS